MRRNSVYIGFIIVGAFVGERVSRGEGGSGVAAPRGRGRGGDGRTRSHNAHARVCAAAQALNSVMDTMWESNNKGVRARAREGEAWGGGAHRAGWGARWPAQALSCPTLLDPQKLYKDMKLEAASE